MADARPQAPWGDQKMFFIFMQCTIIAPANRWKNTFQSHRKAYESKNARIFCSAHDGFTGMFSEKHDLCVGLAENAHTCPITEACRPLQYRTHDMRISVNTHCRIDTRIAMRERKNNLKAVVS
ncbi:hypothetical protein [Saliniramus fredricksonii]|uniref:hypothetical protein n=1 Tax=Saliniramus fredricksonii TaxID=1653334 RepID=UPI0010423539|nr:hypothetical protein [Saliniramus fredricksonii]